jgi:hypothetical protein
MKLMNYRCLLQQLAVICWFSSVSVYAQIPWYEHYENAREAIAETQWQTAITELDRAVALRNSPKLEVETYALRFVDYLPYYWRGVAHFNLGNFAAAKDDFARAADWGVVAKSIYNESYQRYLQLLAQKQALVDSLLVLSQEIRQYRRQAAETAELNQWVSHLLDALLAQRKVEALAALQAIRRFQPEGWPLAEWQQRIEKWATPSAASSLPLEAKFEEAVRLYLTGNYTAALTRFVEIEQHRAGYRNATDWIRKIRSELQRLGQRPDTLLRTIVKTDTMTIAPVVVFPQERQSVRNKTAKISGVVRDDRGIAAVKIMLNGSPLRNQSGDTLTLYPPDEASKKGFRFEIEVPLIPGENQLVAVVTDLDQPSNQAAYPMLIIRKPPIYKEPAVIAAGMVVLLVLFGWLAISRYLRHRIAFINKYNPYIAGAPVLNEKMFFGRNDLLRRILNALPNNSLMLYGPRRIGKTTLLHQLRKKLEQSTDSQHRFFPVYSDLQGVDETRFFATLALDIYEALSGQITNPEQLRISGKPEHYSSRDFSSDLREILRQLPQNSVLVLLIDEVDELNRYSARTNQQLRSIFMKTFAENLVAVMAGSYIRKKWDSEGSPWYNFFSEIAVGPIDREAAEALVRQPVAGIFSYEPAAVAAILEISELRPYHIQKICAGCIARIINHRRKKVTVEDVRQVVKILADDESKQQTQQENYDTTDR